MSAAFSGGLAVSLHSPAFAEQNAKNSSRNAVDKNIESVLPEDQSNEKIFIERTAAIRKAITDREDISVAAQNVKIITLANGTVVLRGPVENDKEKEFIESTANRLSNAAPVKSYLEVNVE